MNSGVLRRCAEYAEEYFEGLEQAPANATSTREELRRAIDTPLPENGLAPSLVLDEIVGRTRGGHLGSAGGRFFAWVIGGGLESAIAADWMTSVWDENVALPACAPAASIVEETVGRWLKELLHIPADASFAMTSGCQMAHFTCLASARNAVLKDVGWNVNRSGLCGSPQIHVLVNAERHGSIDRAIRFLGLGEDYIIPIDTDEPGRMCVESFRAAINTTEGPKIVVLNAADLNTGSFDKFTEIIPIAKTCGAWTHVDGAFGIISRASRRKIALSVGLDLADSWATDGHKWLNVPFDSGLAFVHDAEAHRQTMALSASYIDTDTVVRNPMDWTPEWSRRGRGYALYAALLELGKSGVEALVDRCCLHARTIVEGIGRLPNTEILWRPHLNQGLVRFLDPTPNASEASHDERTIAMIDAINATGEAFFSGTTWQGKRAMRVSVVNWRTNENDVRRAIQAVEQFSSQPS